MRRQYIFVPVTDESLKPVFRQNYESSLSKHMSCVKDGYWRSKGEQITLDSYISRTHHYVPRYVLENGNDIILKGKLQQSLEYCETGTCYFVGSVIYEGKREIVVFVSTPDQMEEQRMECPNDDRLDFCFKEGCLIIENAGFSAKISLPIHPESNCNILNECGYRKVIVKYGMLNSGLAPQAL